MICKLVLHTHPYPLYVDPSHCSIRIAAQSDAYDVRLEINENIYYVTCPTLREAVEEADRLMNVLNHGAQEL